MPQKIKLVDKDGTIANFDSSDGAQITIDQNHHAVHDGTLYAATVDDEDADTGSGQEATMLAYVLNSSVEIHAEFGADVNNESVICIYENPTVRITGVSVFVHNHNRVSTNSSVVQVYGPSVIDSGSGTRLELKTAGSTGQGQSTGGGVAKVDQEFILNSGIYAVSAIPKNDGTVAVLHFDFYEV